ncbi:hypothetical protein DYI26_16920 [Halomonas litopenaei]|nr:hypothetical protein [Halomonas litopenaei]
MTGPTLSTFYLSLSLCPSVPLSLCPSVPLSLSASLPLCLCPSPCPSLPSDSCVPPRPAGRLSSRAR